ncbi:MAG: glycoside hydrolase family 88 protein, partial [Candidatus Angelobacter sp.]
MMITLNPSTWRNFMKRSLTLIALISFIACSGLYGQAAQAPKINPGVGDTPDVAPPLAHLSPALKKKDIAKAMRKVGDWELKRSQRYFDQDWTFAALYAGYMAASKSLPDSQYEKAMLAMGEQFQWKLGPRLIHADDQAIGQTYLELYATHHDPRMIAPLQNQFDQLMKTSDDPAKPVWWWCDALFMAPPVWARLSQATGEKSYLDYMD